MALGVVHTRGDLTKFSEPQLGNLQSGNQNTAPTTFNGGVRLTKKKKQVKVFGPVLSPKAGSVSFKALSF